MNKKIRFANILIASTLTVGGIALAQAPSALAAGSATPVATPSPRPQAAPTPPPTRPSKPSAVSTVVTQVSKSPVVTTLETIDHGLANTGIFAAAAQTGKFLFTYVKVAAYIWIYGQ